MTSDSKELSQACALSLTRKSKLAQSNAFLREWRNRNLMRLRFGAISAPSLGKHFVGLWTLSLADTRVSPSPVTERSRENGTPVISGLISQMEFALCDQPGASSKMSKDTLPSGSVTSSTTWDQWVTERRGDYLVRLRQVRLNLGSEYILWPTIRASEWKGCGPLGSKSHVYRLKKYYLDAVAQDRIGQTGRLNPYWCEWLMGVPNGWTESASSGTQSSLPWRRLPLEP